MPLLQKSGMYLAIILSNHEQALHPETLTEEGRDLVAEVWEGLASPRPPEGVIPLPPTRQERAEHAARDVGSAR